MAGAGRGGRGAAILEALKRQSETPGQTDPGVPSLQQPERTGRGRAALADLLARCAIAPPSPGSSEDPSTMGQESLAQPVQPFIGRGGRGIAPTYPGSSREPATVGQEPLAQPVQPIIGRGGRGIAPPLPRSSGEPATVGQKPLAQPAQPTIGRGGRGMLLSMLQETKALQSTERSSVRPVGGLTTSRTPQMGLPRASQEGLPEHQPVVCKAPPTTSTARLQERRTHPQLEPRGADMTVPKSLQETPPVICMGTSGTQASVLANYVRLTLEPGRGVFEYEVTFEPSVDSMDMRYKILRNQIKGPQTFDGSKLYLPIVLEHKVTNYSACHPMDNSSIIMTVVYKHQKRLGECIHLYNVLFRKIMNVLHLVRIGRMHFNPNTAHLIPQHRLEVWPGYVTAVDEYEGGIQLCCDISHRVLRKDTVLDLVGDLVNRNRGNYRDLVKKAVLGATVLTRYNNKTYRVDDVNWSQTPNSTFTNSTGQEITFKDYYKHQYNITIKDLVQPMLISQMKKKGTDESEVPQLICLVPELCYLTGLTDEMRQDFRIMKDIATYTRVSPNQRHASLRKFIGSVNGNPEAMKLLSDWGLHLAPDIIQLNARVVPIEKIYVGNNASHSVNPQADWGQAICRSEVLNAVDLVKWLVLHTSRDTPVARDFVGLMRKVGPQMGIQVGNGNLLTMQDDRTDTYLKALRSNIRPDLQVVVLIFPTSRDDRYSAVKKLCCVEMPIASQVINAKTLSRPDRMRSVVQKIALQINCKLGGSLWALQIPFDHCMVCGIDAYHNSAQRSASVAGFVASLNQSLTRWYSTVCFQGPNQEIVDGLRTCLISALQKYYEINHRFPDRIIIYRDGVGDGQLNVVSQYEIPQLQGCFSFVNPSYNPRLCFIICQKRINTRYFARTGRGDLENPVPGTIVDHCITRRNWYDFFLVSQHVRQGTVTPTHYIVLHDSSNMKIDYVQRLTYKLCHLYYNWPGTIRVPAPCQYAHKIANLVGQNIHKQPSERLSDRLYFL